MKVKPAAALGVARLKPYNPGPLLAPGPDAPTIGQPRLW
jgi:hypothetical protein